VGNLFVESHDSFTIQALARARTDGNLAGQEESMARPAPNLTLPLLLGLATTLPAQDEWADFRSRLDNELRTHSFFSRVKVTAVEHRPFLFYIEQAADGNTDHEAAVVNGCLPFLKELVAQWQHHYGSLGRKQSAKAPGYAIAVLSSGGRYLDFRTAINDPSLANARAHYTPDLRLAVTYLDTFGASNKAEEIHSLLHEVVHAMQHAYSKGDRMTAPVWFNEGLADYRSACSTMVKSLREPPLQENHLIALTFGYANRAGRPYVHPIAELVTPTSYAEVIELVKKRQSSMRPELALGMFYSQSEMFVRFLHEAELGARHPQFLKYLELVLDGASGLQPFQQAFGCASAEELAKLDLAWRRWLDGVLRARVPNLPNLAGDAASTGPEPMAPPVAFAVEGLAWRDEDLEERLGAARRLCGRGEFDAALAALPDASNATDKAVQQRLKRESDRIAALRQLRQKVIEDLLRGKNVLVLGDLRGKVVKRDETGLTIQIGKDTKTVPVSRLGPKELLAEGTRLKAFEGRAVWLRVWLRYLQGTPLAQLKKDLAESFSTIAELRQDMTVEFSATPGAGAEALLELQSMPATEDAAAARQNLKRLQELVQANRSSPLLTSRLESIRHLARCYAERAFSPDDVAGLGLTGTTTSVDGTTTVVYDDPSKSPTADFTAVPASDREWLRLGEPLEYAGTHGLTPAAKGYQMAGSALLRWAAPLQGAFRIEIVYRVPENVDAHFAMLLMTQDEGTLWCSMAGSVGRLDRTVKDFRQVGGGASYTIGQPVTWSLEFDGKSTLVTQVLDKETARFDTKGRNAGELWIAIECGAPMPIDRLTIRGKPVAKDPGKVREQFVARVLERL